MQYSTNIKSVISQLKLELMSVKQLDPLLRTVATTLRASNLRRIHNQGRSVDGGQIGKYSIKPTLIGKTSFTSKAAANKVLGSKAKRSSLSWVTIVRGGKVIRLAVLQGGYKEIRQIEGREVSFVNLQRTSKLFKDLVIGTDGKDWIVGMNTAYGADLHKWLEQKYNKTIWGVTKGDEVVIEKLTEAFIESKLK